jgi:23S rRNA (uracil1939-C5)-methyltransferase
VKITALSNDGCGVGRASDGKVVFVPFTAVGDEAEVRAVKTTKSAIRAEIHRILTPSADRTQADCDSYMKCGGCDFRHISYEAEIKGKESFIRDAFARIGGFISPEIPDFLSVLPSDNTNYYRNKTQFPVGENAAGNLVYGFYAPKSNRIIPHEHCKLYPPLFAEIAEFITANIKNTKNASRLNHIRVRKSHYQGETHVTLFTSGNNSEIKKLAGILSARFPGVKGVGLNISGSSVFSGKYVNLTGESRIRDSMCGVDIVISPNSFYQVNTPAAEKLYRLVRDFAEPNGKVIMDLYCGIGSIGLSMANRAKKIIGVEAVESAVKDARKNAEINGFSNAEFICADVLAEIAKSKVRPDVIILDPARQGCESEVLEYAAKLSPGKIVMVSCNPATAARDCAKLRDCGYEAVKIGGVDLFPRTRHVECIALMVRPGLYNGG